MGQILKIVHFQISVIRPQEAQFWDLHRGKFFSRLFSIIFRISCFKYIITTIHIVYKLLLTLALTARLHSQKWLHQYWVLARIKGLRTYIRTSALTIALENGQVNHRCVSTWTREIFAATSTCIENVLVCIYGANSSRLSIWMRATLCLRQKLGVHHTSISDMHCLHASRLMHANGCLDLLKHRLSVGFNNARCVWNILVSLKFYHKMFSLCFIYIYTQTVFS